MSDDEAAVAGNKPIRLPIAKVRNKAPAPLQITAEQLLREAKERELELIPPAPKTKITDPDELKEYQRKKRKEFEDGYRKNRMQLANWIKYGKWEESIGEVQRARSVFERALDVDIYHWINYALYEELVAKDFERARQVYKACLEIIPHKAFTFAKVWILFAHFEIRPLDLAAARKILGVSIGKCPKDKLFRAYIDLELQLREFDRCRKLYEKFLESSSESSQTWIKFAVLESLLGDTDRARAVFTIAVQQPALDMPELLWKAYIDSEIASEEHERARDLYETLLQRTNHIKVWTSMAEFEQTIGNFEGARKVYEKANQSLENAEKEERLMLLEAWKECETKSGDEEALKRVEMMMPRKVKKRRQIQTEDGVDAGWEEYFDYIFPQDQAAKGSFKLLEAAARWKKQREEAARAAQEELDNPVAFDFFRLPLLAREEVLNWFNIIEKVNLAIARGKWNYFDLGRRRTHKCRISISENVNVRFKSDIDSEWSYIRYVGRESNILARIDGNLFSFPTNQTSITFLEGALVYLDVDSIECLTIKKMAMEQNFDIFDFLVSKNIEALTVMQNCVTEFAERVIDRLDHSKNLHIPCHSIWKSDWTPFASIVLRSRSLKEEPYCILELMNANCTYLTIYGLYSTNSELNSMLATWASRKLSWRYASIILNKGVLDTFDPALIVSGLNIEKLSDDEVTEFTDRNGISVQLIGGWMLSSDEYERKCLIKISSHPPSMVLYETYKGTTAPGHRSPYEESPGPSQQ